MRFTPKKAFVLAFVVTTALHYSIDYALHSMDDSRCAMPFSEQLKALDAFGYPDATGVDRFACWRFGDRWAVRFTLWPSGESVWRAYAGP